MGGESDRVGDRQVGQHAHRPVENVFFLFFRFRCAPAEGGEGGVCFALFCFILFCFAALGGYGNLARGSAAELGRSFKLPTSIIIFFYFFCRVIRP